MNMLIDLMTPLTAWHWLAIALILLGIEVMFGTFDLLWMSVAGFMTATFKALAPAMLGTWQMQCVFFFGACVVLVILGRTVFSSLRTINNHRPYLNKRMSSLIGQHGAVSESFRAGQGRVKIGDTVWSAMSVDGQDFLIGTSVRVESAEGNAVRVDLA